MMTPFYRQILSLKDWPRYTVHQDGQAVSGDRPYARAFRLEADAEDMIRWEQYANSALHCEEEAESMTNAEWVLAKGEMKAKEANQRQMRKKQRKEAVERMLAKAASLTLADARRYTNADPVICTREDAYFPYEQRDPEREAVMEELRTVSTNKGPTMNLIPFNVEKAKEGAQIMTRAGLPARVLCYDFKGDELSVVAAITEDDGEILIRHTTEGMVYTSGEHSNFDLFLVPKTKKVWLWVYKDLKTGARGSTVIDDEKELREWQEQTNGAVTTLLEQEIEILDI